MNIRLMISINLSYLASTTLLCLWGSGIALGSTCEDLALSLKKSGHAMGRLIDAGCFKEAEQLGLVLVASDSNESQKGTLYNDLGVVHEKMGRYDQAKQDYERALALFGDSSKALPLKVNFAALLYRKGEYLAARKAYQEILSALDKVVVPNLELQSAALGGLGLVLQTIGEHAEAKLQLQRALQVDLQLFGEVHPYVASDLSNLGDEHRSLGEYDQAFPVYEKALAIRRTVLRADHPDLANSLSKLAYVYDVFGQTETALSLYREALQIRVKSLPAMHPHIAVARSGIADALRRLGRNEEALLEYGHALAISEKALPANHPDIGRTLHYLGQVQFTLGKTDQARISLQRAINIRSHSLGAFHALTAESMGVYGSYLALSGDVSDRVQGALLMTKAYSIALASGELGVAVDVGAALSKYYALNQKRELAIFYGKQSVNMMQRIRTQSRGLDKGLQKSLLGNNEGIYKQLSALLIDGGRLAEAQQVMAMLKEEEYFDFIQRDSKEEGLEQRASLNGAEATWAQRYAEISGKLAGIGRELGELRKKQEQQALNSKEQSRLNALEHDIDVANQAFDNMMNQLIAGLADNQTKQSVSDKADDIGARQGTLDELGAGTVLLQYLVLNDKVSILLTTPTVRLARESKVSQTELNHLVASFRETLRNPELDPQTQSQALYQLLIAPIAADLEQAHAKVIMLSLDGTLRYLPFAALNDGRNYLVEHYALSLYNEAAADKLKDKNAITWKVWGLGVTQAHPGFKALNSVKGELDGIVNQVGLSGQTLLDEAFNEQALKSGVSQHYPVLHIASHFKFTPGTLSDSYLLLGDATHLSLQDVKVRYSFIGVDLITLSACETGFGGGQDSNGREVEGLGAIMQKKGAKSVMATLWPVEDSSTAQLMRGFYHIRQQQHLNKAESLRQAQLEMIKGGSFEKTTNRNPDERSLIRVLPAGESNARGTPFQRDSRAPFAHPYFWAPFILMGNWL